MGIIVDLDCLPAATILDGDGATWVCGSPFLVVRVPSNCFSSAIVLASY